MGERNDIKIPYNLEAEQAILGCMIIDNRVRPARRLWRF